MPGYVYAEQRDSLFSEGGQVLFLQVRDRVQKLLSESRAVRMDAVLDGRYDGGRDDWKILACVDRMVELKELTECRYGECAGQHRVFMSNRQA